MTVRKAGITALEDVPAGTGTRRQVLIGDDLSPHFAIRRFVMDPGGGMPLHTNAVEHGQYVLAGGATIRIGEETVQVGPGDVVHIPGGVPHAYRVEGEAAFEFLCVVPKAPDETVILEEDS